MGISGYNYFSSLAHPTFPSIYVNNIPKKENQAETPGKWGKKRLRIFP